MKEKILISACLIGQNVKYNGKNNQIDISSLEEKYELIPFCPEVEGGLSIPRPPSEIISFEPLKIKNIKGEDVTNSFVKGAKKAVKLVQKYNIKKAILKSNSPSCSNKLVYDGTFSAKLIPQKGITTQFLEKIGVKVYNEKELKKLKFCDKGIK